MTDKTIASYMTRDPLVVEKSTSAARALSIMVDSEIRHLPVVDNGDLIGVVSERDLKIIENMESVDSAFCTVGDAVVIAPYAVGPDAQLVDVLKEMVERKLGSTVVTEGGKVVGIFTAVDGLRVLADLIGK